MVDKRVCSFCGVDIEPGTGKMYVKKDGTVYNFCSNKCKKNRIDIGRVPRRTRWTVRYDELKTSSLRREGATSGTKDDADSEKSESKKSAASKKTKSAKKEKPAKKNVSEKEPAKEE